MAEKSVFDQIKKQNGEAFAKAIRKYHSGIFDIPGIVDIVKYAGRDAEPIKHYLISLKNIEVEEFGPQNDPLVLLDLAGYNAFYADTLEKQNSIADYFQPSEQLCTFRDRRRYLDYYIVHAVKKDVDQIRREDFKSPNREDAYGTSVISIQIAKNGGFISIKNRYNHAVPSPDNTFSSNPDYIIDGLSNALKQHFKVDFYNQKTSLPDGYVLMRGQIVKYHCEVGNIYFGEDFYAKAGIVYALDKNTQLMLDRFIFDAKTKELSNPADHTDWFIKAFNEEIENRRIQISRDEAGYKCLFADDVCLLKTKDGQITYLNLPHVTKIGNNFLSSNTAATEVNLPHVTTIGDNFLSSNTAVTEVNLPNATTIGDRFLYSNTAATKVNLPHATTIGDNFLSSNTAVTEVNLPHATTIGNNFLPSNTAVTEVNLPNATTIGNSFLYSNTAVTKVNLPHATTIGDNFLSSNTAVTEVNLPHATTIGNNFLYSNTAVTKVNLPHATTIGDSFLSSNTAVTEVNLPNEITIGDRFLYSNIAATKVNLPHATTIGHDFLASNTAVTEVNLPNEITTGDGLYKLKSIGTKENPSYYVPTIRDELLSRSSRFKAKVLKKNLFQRIIDFSKGFK